MIDPFIADKCFPEEITLVFRNNSHILYKYTVLLPAPFRGPDAMNMTSLIITDSRPLIDLAIADELDTLLALAPQMRVLIPDMVRHDLVAHVEIPGAPDVLEWIRANDGGNVSVLCTEEFEEFIVLRHNAAGTAARGHNEHAAAEILGRELARGADAVILLLDDASARHAPFLKNLPENVLLMSTCSYLDKLKSRQMRATVSALLQRFMTRGRPRIR